MRKRVTHINVRTTPEEKARFEKNAAKCGMSLSAYLRALADEHEPKALPPIQYGELVKALSNSYNLFRYRKKDDAAERILYLVKRLTEAIVPDKVGGISEPPQSCKLCGEKEQPRSGESFASQGESDERRVL